MHIKLNGASCKHIFCPYTHPRPLGPKVKTFFLKVVKLKGMEHRRPCKYIICPYSHPQPVGLIKRFNNSECGHVAYQIKGKEV